MFCVTQFSKQLEFRAFFYFLKLPPEFQSFGKSLKKPRNLNFRAKSQLIKQAMWGFVNFGRKNSKLISNETLSVTFKHYEKISHKSLYHIVLVSI